MIKGNKCEQKWHVWYERGVENKLRVTRLYEYYLLSTDLSRDIEPPKSVLLYFAYQCNLDWEYAAWLYSCVERCKTKDPELYITYKPEMDHFLLDCLNKGRINRHLSWLYRENLPALALDKTQGETITSLLGSTEVVLNRKECRKLIVVHRRLKGEETYWLQDGKVCVSVYDPEDLLFTEDEEQNRCLVTVDRKELLSFQNAVSAWGMEALREWGTESIAFLLEAEKRKLLRETLFNAVKNNELQIKERTAFEYCGFKIILPANMAKGKPFVWLEREGKYYVELGDTEVGVLIRIDNYLNNLDKHIENQQKQLFNMGERKKGIQKELGNDENYADVIAELKEKLAEIDNKLGVNKK